MKNQASFVSKDKSKKLKCRLLQCTESEMVENYFQFMFTFQRHHLTAIFVRRLKG